VRASGRYVVAHVRGTRGARETTRAVPDTVSGRVDPRESGLLRHQWDGDCHAGITFVAAADLPALAGADLYEWGDFVWADYASPEPPTLLPEAMAELLYFGHAAAPLRDIAIHGLGNRFLGAGHDDGWRLILHYTDRRHVEELLDSLLPSSVLAVIGAELRDGTCGSWIERGRFRLS